jgi:predicted ATPase/DNA-binding CsgD family transcriptional regulator
VRLRNLWQTRTVARAAPASALTAREEEVLALVQRWRTNAEIAAELYVGVRTVETHVSSILRKLGVPDRRALAMLATAGDASGEPAHTPATVGRLPALRAELIGRAATIAVVGNLLRTGRLVTLVGPGGVGKTSVALAVGHDQLSRWRDGVAFVDLVPARSPSDVLAATAEALGVDGDAARSPANLAEHLADRTLLVILDNCEHVSAAVADLVDGVLGLPGGSRVMATSREPLGLTEELLVPVEPLGREAADLFVARARRLEPRRAWDATDLEIVELCDRLDGLPLAIELAAGQVRRWSLSELHRQLTDPASRFRPEATRGEPRHQTMSTAIDWSYSLLDGRERWLLRHLGVFPAAFTLDDLAALPPRDDGEDIDLPRITASLVDKSLIVREVDGDTYRLLETIRAFAIDRLGQSDEMDDAFEHHRRWAVRQARASSRMDRWFSGRLAAGHRAVAEHVAQAYWASVESGHLADAVDLALTRSFLWRNAVGCADGRRWLDALATGDLDDASAAWVAVMRADVAQGDGDFASVIDAATEGARRAIASDPDADALSRHFLMFAHLLDRERIDDVLGAVDAVSTDARLSNLLRAFGLAAHAGRLAPEDLRREVDAIEAAHSADGYERFIANWAIWLNGLATRDTYWARRGITQQYEYLHQTGLAETWLTSFSLAVTEMIDGHSGRERLARTVEVASREGYRIEGDCVLALAYSEACRGAPEEAGELLGLARTCRFNATAHHVLHGVVVDPIVRAALGEPEYAAATARGSRASVAELLSEYGLAPSR